MLLSTLLIVSQLYQTDIFEQRDTSGGRDTRRETSLKGADGLQLTTCTDERNMAARIIISNIIVAP